MAEVQKPVGDTIQTPKRAKGATKPTISSTSKSTPAKRPDLSQAKSASAPQAPTKTPAKESGKQTPRKNPSKEGDMTYKVQNAADKAQSNVKNANRGAEGQPGEILANGVDQNLETSENSQNNGVTDAEQTGEDQTSNAQSKAENVVEGATEQAEQTAEDAEDQAQDAQDDAEDQAQDARDTGEDVAQAGRDPADAIEQTAQEGADSDRDVPDDAEEVVQGARNGTDQVNAQEESNNEGQVQADGEDEGGDDEGEEVIPIGTVQKDGSVIDDDGNVIGQLSEGNAEELEGSTVDQSGDVLDDDGNVVGKAEPNEEGAFQEDEDQDGQDAGDDATQAATAAGDATDDLKDQAQDTTEPLTEKVSKPEFEGALKSDESGNITDETGKTIANISKGDIGAIKNKEIKDIDEDGNLLDGKGNTLAKATLADQEDNVQDVAEEATDEVPKPEFVGALKADESGNITDETGKTIANISADDIEALKGKEVKDIDQDGNLLDDDGNVLAKATLADQQDPPGEDQGQEDENSGEDQQQEGENEEDEPLDYSLISGMQVNKAGNIVNEDGEVVGRLVEGEAKKLAGKTCAEDGQIYDNKGKVIGRAEPLRASEREPQEESGPFEDFPGAIVERSGDVTYEGKTVGKVIEGQMKKLEGKQVDSDGDILDKNGNTIGRAERLEDEAEEEEPQTDYSILEGLTVNKSGNVVNEKGSLVGRIVEGEIKKLANRKIYENGQIWNDSGKVIGRAEPIPEDERMEEEGDAPFDDHPDSIVQKNGDVLYEGTKIGEVIEGDPKKLSGKKVDADGDIVDRHGTAVGKAARWEEPEAEPEPEVDNSALAGKRVNKMGNVVDEHGSIYGKVVEGNAKKLAGKMCDKKGDIWDEGGNVVGRAELVPESERSGSKEGPFADYQPCTVTKEGKVVFGEQVVGRLTTGDPKQLAGRHVDEDGEVLDANGNSIAKAERWEEPEEEKFQHQCYGLKVNKEGNVIDSNGNTIAKLTEGTANRCAGQKIDEDGNVVDGKGNAIGYVTMLQDIPEPEKTDEEIEEERKAKEDKELANRMSSVIEDSIEKIKPVLKEMTDAIEQCENTPEKDRDEEKLVETVKPLIEKGGNILQETNGAIRGMDPDGRIQSKAKQKTKSGEGTPEEYRLADQLKQLTGDVTETIDKCKKKIQGMPHAKSELNPLWGLMQEPLFQILAAVGLLLSGVLGLVGKLLGGLGLGGLVDGLLGGLGLNKVVDSLGIFGKSNGKK